MILKIRTKNGFIQELREIELLEIDGVSFAQLTQPQPEEIENRLVLVERALSRLITEVEPMLQHHYSTSLSNSEFPNQEFNNPIESNNSIEFNNSMNER